MSNIAEEAPENPALQTATQPKRMSAMAITGFVIAVGSFMFSWIPFLNIGSMIFGFLALPFLLVGIIATRRKGKKRGFWFALSGAVVAIVAIIIAFNVTKTAVNVVSDALNNEASQAGSPGNGSASKPFVFGKPVTYKNGIVATVGQPAEFRPSSWALSDIKNPKKSWKISVAIVGGKEDNVVLSTIDGYSVSGTACTQVFDSSNLQGDLDGDLPVGTKKTATFGFSCPDSQGLKVRFQPDVLTAKYWYAGK